MIPDALAQLLYLAAAVLFIVGLRRLGSPATARAGNRLSGVGMLVAIVVTLLDRAILSYGVIAAGIAVGSAVGIWMARAVKMTAMPQMVALLNGFGGGSSLLVGGAEFLRAELVGEQVPVPTGVTIQLSILIGAVTLSGSLVAYAKLQELVTGRPITFGGQTVVNALLFAAILGLSAYQLLTPDPLLWPFYAVCALSLLIGVLLVLPIGGADMPVVISLLNSYSGIAAAMTGFVIGNSVLIIAGALVGSSGIILSQIMCRAMNRSLANVVFGAFGAQGGGAVRSAEGLSVRSISPEDAAIQLAYARRVIIVPGYGMAVAQSQHQVRELAELIERKGGDVRYAIHPVAGRMPGHMNVLLAEANVPYDKLYDMEEINGQFAEADVALVIGANDVVNPAARADPASPIYGMPILDVDRAKAVIVMKRSMSSGFAGIENALFYDAKTSMLFGDAKQSLAQLVGEVKNV
ncbi:MAG: NAD(P) transhydrogenase subunit beta [uncultured Gemmatimonadaceae bacterium]|uniref:NAD(P) transhydrogenase subunit beta n=1 Tax=uncultured Gemmatimonadaceae bacterium TaxID=246130 RepID=A0A6J4LBX8_9BACT|nr:MAG: NAD(P) transhydrogenase subunit beta [uncultured Gemmatimonadaceae bacterium]